MGVSGFNSSFKTKNRQITKHLKKNPLNSCYLLWNYVESFYCRFVSALPSYSTDCTTVIIYDGMAPGDLSRYFTVCPSKRKEQIKEQRWHLSTLSFPGYVPVLSRSLSSNPPWGGKEINSAFIISIKSLSLEHRGKARCRSFSSFSIPAVKV